MIRVSSSRLLIAALLLCGLSGTALADDKAARQVPVKKLLPYYDLYLSLPAQDRDGFELDYFLTSKGTDARPRLTYVNGATRTPVQTDRNGKILNLPDLAMLRQGKVEIPAGAPPGGITLELEPVLTLARTIPASQAANPVQDYAKAIGRAGPLSLVAPKLPGLTFKGVASGQAVLADGRKVALPVEGGNPIFRPGHASMRGAVSLEFPNVPSKAEFTR